MHFCLIDAVVERSRDRLVADKLVTSGEEYLQDHFPSFPVLPGVMMLETLVQAGRELVGSRDGGPPLVLGGVRALRYGHFVRPGQILRVEVVAVAREGEVVEFKGSGRVVDPAHPGDAPPTAVACRFSLRPVHLD